MTLCLLVSAYFLFTGDVGIAIALFVVALCIGE